MKYSNVNWKFFFHQEKKILLDILHKVYIERKKKVIYPISSEVFNAFRLTPFNKIKVVIVGQDPYHNVNQAHGLAFSVKKGCSIPPSLKNIFKEVINDLCFQEGYYTHGCLDNWAKQGVLLLNSILTVESNKPNSHKNIGWKYFTDKMIYYISSYLNNIIFILWGSEARKKNIFINKNNYILYASHPSTYSANFGFLGCRHFSITNGILLFHNKGIIHW